MPTVNMNDKSEASLSSAEGDLMETGSVSGQSESGGGGESTTSATESTGAKFARRETRDVRRTRMVVLLVLVCSALGVAASAFFYVTISEDEQFKRQFKDDSDKILDAIGYSFEKMFGALDSVSITLLSHAHDTNKTWPFLTLPNFAVRMSKIVPLTDMFNLQFVPLVTHANRPAWEVYSKQNNDWINESVDVQKDWDGYHGPVVYDGTYSDAIHGDYEDAPKKEFHLVTWQNFPVIPNTSWTYNWDWLSSTMASSFNRTIEQHRATVSLPYLIPSPDNPAAAAETIAWGEYYRAFISEDEEPEEPASDIAYPMIDTVNRITVTGADNYDPDQHTLLGVMGGSFYFRDVFRNILPPESDGIQIVVSNPCAAAPFTYVFQGPNVKYLGPGDKHDRRYHKLGRESQLDTLDRFAIHTSGYTGAPIDNSVCPYTISLYPSVAMKARFTSNNAIIFTVCALCIFAFTSLVFYIYDLKVEHRQERVLKTAVRSSAIVSSLFPSAVRDRVFPEAPETAKGKLHNFLRDKTPPQDLTSTGSSPIAELYPETTVLFADIVGFTSWSSSRQPTQVFHLLESVFAAFDEIAKRRGVFKVETIGDSYVAVVGLPTPRKHHAVTMARFANDCRTAMYDLTRELDTVLGPGTAELAMRFGLNSGPTTAGVLRGEKSRFQLFGDTVNTAARMESNGKPHEIQVSQKTAELLKIAGKTHWLTRREEQVDCKGKGMMTCYWCNPSTLGSASVASRSECSQFETDSVDENRIDAGLKGNLNGLVDWNFDLLQGLLKDIVGYRAEHSCAVSQTMSASLATRTPRDEVVEVLVLPKTLRSWPDCASTKKRAAPVLSDVVLAQLRELVVSIAKRYHANAFHNFEHCSHVVMSTRKLLARIAVRAVELRNKNKKGNCTMDQGICAIVCHPMTQFALVLAALIHDVDHPGVSNAQLVQEGSDVAVAYNGQSVAEQRSIDVAWNLLAQSQFAALMDCLYATPSELAHFRQVMVHAVMATDLFDPDLKAMREARWIKSFHTTNGMSCETDEDVNRRATIVLELIIQASDVSHTMQHFTVYRKWNQRLLTEMHEAYASGRTTKNPLEGWYEGELGFLDHYVIPLAQKLRECGVFGVACDEFLDYARDNRLEWESKGRDIVRNVSDEMISPGSTTTSPNPPVASSRDARFFL